MLQYHNSRSSKQKKELLGLVYVPIPYNLLKLQNEYTRHVSISYDFLIHFVLSSKFSKLFHHIWFFSVCQRSFSWVHTIWHCNLTVPWPTLCHYWGYSINNLMLITACYSPLTWSLLGALYRKVGSQTRTGQTPSEVWTGILQIINVTTYPTGPFSLVLNVYGPLDYSLLVFNVYSSFLGWFFVSKFCFSVFSQFVAPGCLILKELLAKMKFLVLVI